MKLKDLIPCCTSELWITFEEDPNRAKPEITINLTSGSDWTLEEIFSSALLEEPVHLLKAESDDVLFASLGWE